MSILTEDGNPDGPPILVADAIRFGGYGADSFVQSFDVPLPPAPNVLLGWTGGPSFSWLTGDTVTVNDIALNGNTTQTATATGTYGASVGHNTAADGSGSTALGAFSVVKDLTSGGPATTSTAGSIALGGGEVVVNGTGATAVSNIVIGSDGVGSTVASVQSIGASTNADNNIVLGKLSYAQANNDGAQVNNNIVAGASGLSTEANGLVATQNILIRTNAAQSSVTVEAGGSYTNNISITAGQRVQTITSDVTESTELGYFAEANATGAFALDAVVNGAGAVGLGQCTVDDDNVVGLGCNGVLIQAKPATYQGYNQATSFQTTVDTRTFSPIMFLIKTFDAPPASPTQNVFTVLNNRIGSTSLIRCTALTLGDGISTAGNYKTPVISWMNLVGYDPGVLDGSVDLVVSLSDGATAPSLGIFLLVEILYPQTDDAPVSVSQATYGTTTFTMDDIKAAKIAKKKMPQAPVVVPKPPPPVVPTITNIAHATSTAARNVLFKRKLGDVVPPATPPSIPAASVTPPPAPSASVIPPPPAPVVVDTTSKKPRLWVNGREQV